MITTGIDIEDISRFENKTLEKDKKFLDRIYTKDELDYCFKFSNPASRLAARYCAKEAVVKALSNLYSKTISYNKIEVVKKTNGSVGVNILIDELKKYNYSLSISHDKTKAVAFVVVSD